MAAPCAAFSVKHLNPRQGITITASRSGLLPSLELRSVKHLNPRQGITIPRRTSRAVSGFPELRVKHLNPRQGITIQDEILVVHEGANKV